MSKRKNSRNIIIPSVILLAVLLTVPMLSSDKKISAAGKDIRLSFNTTTLYLSGKNSVVLTIKKSDSSSKTTIKKSEYKVLKKDSRIIRLAGKKKSSVKIIAKKTGKAVIKIKVTYIYGKNKKYTTLRCKVSVKKKDRSGKASGSKDPGNKKNNDSADDSSKKTTQGSQNQSSQGQGSQGQGSQGQGSQGQSAQNPQGQNSLGQGSQGQSSGDQPRVSDSPIDSSPSPVPTPVPEPTAYRTPKPEKDVITPVIQGGMTLPVFPYTDGTVEGYSNEKSNIIRYAVYVETDYDTDNDGKRDLVKAVVQVPKAAVDGDYKAASLFIANPYSTGENVYEEPYVSGSDFDLGELKKSVPARIPDKVLYTEDAAKSAVRSDWYYKLPAEVEAYGEDKAEQHYSLYRMYDYYLVRGFAVIESAGLGTYGSEGLQCCGTKVEAESMKNIVEWLHGDRTAYTDLTGNVAVLADWSSGHTAMTGLSWLGTMAYEVATTGVEGLDTVVPLGGVSSWYDYCNSQGVYKFEGNYNYIDFLGFDVATAYSDRYALDDRYKRYVSYISRLKDDQAYLKADYGDFWKSLDFSDGGDLKVPAIIVQGMNDDNVTMKQSDLMRRAFKNHDQNVKLLLHQGAHEDLFYYEGEYRVGTDNECYSELMNRWYSHYLLGVDNGAENIPEIMWQSNIDGKYKNYTEWDAKDSVRMEPEDKSENHVVRSKGAKHDNKTLLNSVLKGASSANTYCIKKVISEDTHIQGAIEVHLKAAVNSVNKPGDLMMSAMLVDTAEEKFPAYIKDSNGDIPWAAENNAYFDVGQGLYGERIVYKKQTQTDKKLISQGWVDLENPAAGYLPETAVTPAESVKTGEYYDYTIYLQPCS